MCRSLYAVTTFISISTHLCVYCGPYLSAFGDWTACLEEHKPFK